MVGHNELTAVICLYVCPSAPCLTLSPVRKGIESWKLTGRKPATRVTRDPI